MYVCVCTCVRACMSARVCQKQSNGNHEQGSGAPCQTSRGGFTVRSTVEDKLLSLSRGVHWLASLPVTSVFLRSVSTSQPTQGSI